jgi:signal transduction histidine kinase
MRADLVAGLVLTALGLVMSFGENPSPEAVLIPLATLPVIWRRRAPVACAVAVTAGIVVTYGQPRCGATVPAVLLILYTLATRVDGLGGPLLLLAALSYLSLTDPIVAPVALAFFVPIWAAVFASGRVVRSRERIAARLQARTRELERERERTAELAVAIERDRLAGELDATARERTRRMIALAERGERGDFGEIERLGRESLNEMRELLGALRSDTRTPQPTLGQLADGRVTVLGEQRPLAAGVELAAYRIVEHALAGAARVSLH